MVKISVNHYRVYERHITNLTVLNSFNFNQLKFKTVKFFFKKSENLKFVGSFQQAPLQFKKASVTELKFTHLIIQIKFLELPFLANLIDVTSS